MARDFPALFCMILAKCLWIAGKPQKSSISDINAILIGIDLDVKNYGIFKF